ncbi:hypothetical protein M426DRAFT_316091 [Hypoxylon sp. CI-4A]|nr:hypothetical protein M426DRAFT_316091 [Hypoxylon sp. CI-4A]
MRRWILGRSSVLAGFRSQRIRCFSAVVNDVETVSVRNGSSGVVTIDLHNIAKVSSPVPLLIYLPPYSTAFADKPARLPSFLERKPTAVINYRWVGFGPFPAPAPLPQPSEPDEQLEENDLSILSWPAAIHDTARAYEWIVENLGPSTYTRRDIYVYGSYLGASLATSLALTETHPHARMGIRGCVAYNGIYNWTMFLPDHSINQAPKQRGFMGLVDGILSEGRDPDFQQFKQHAEPLFGSAANLFDPFASSCLFFHTPGLLVPPSFDKSALPSETSISEELDMLAEDAMNPSTPIKSPRKSPLVFPPRKSTLKIPEVLLLHSTPPPPPPSFQRRVQRRRKERPGNNFKAQAEELAGLMRRSIDKVELKERRKWDEDHDRWDDEADRRIQVEDVGLYRGKYELGDKGEELAAAWLRDHMG